MANWKQVNPYFGSKEGLSSFPNSPGNYAIYAGGRLIYIGTAENLYKRLEKHEVVRVARSLSDEYIFIKCKVVLDKYIRLNEEYKLIKKLKPKANNEPKKVRFTSNAVLCG